MKPIIWILAAIVSAMSAGAAEAAGCEHWKLTEIRCLAHQTKSYTVLVKPGVSEVTFGYSAYSSVCGHGGRLRASGENARLGSGGGFRPLVTLAGLENCGELFLFNCKNSGRTAACANVLDVRPD